jgi:hypothetical protein
MKKLKMIQMNKSISAFLFSVLLLAGGSGCKKFLDVTPIDNLAGNDFWQTKSDFNAFALGIYSNFRTYTEISNQFFVTTGDLRCAPTNTTPSYSTTYFIADLRSNALGTMLARSAYTGWTITKWNSFYAIIQEANILYLQAGKSTVLSASDKKYFQAEAVFQRCLAYFLMVRIYGDVPYYTDAYHTIALPRTNMVTVLKNCIADLSAVKDDLPWTYTDPSVVGVRAMRGGAIALLMHMNMWAAGFDNTVNGNNYYTAVDSLGKSIMEDNQGAYQLLPLTNTSNIFRGNSKEGLFEIVQNYNDGELFNLNSIYSNYVLIKPYSTSTVAYFYYDPAFMLKIYPGNVVDGRKKQWFDANMYATDGTAQMLKFIDSTKHADANNTNMRGNRIVFRYTDAVLLRAEALADLNQDAEALSVVNLVRERAGAPDFTSSGQGLKDDIYWERVRELMGEGHYYYDLVRTRKVTDGSYCYAPLTVAAFNNGAWTWPIDISALTNNPYMTFNQYWNQ